MALLLCFAACLTFGEGSSSWILKSKPRPPVLAGNSSNSSEHNNGWFIEDSEEAEKIDELVEKAVLPVSFGLLVTLILAPAFEKLHISWIPESLVVIVIGMFLGLLLIMVMGSEVLVEQEILHEINAPLLNIAFLPIIIFEGGWSLRWKDFAAQLPYILIFAILGSVTSMAVVAGLVYATGSHHGVTSFRTAFAFGSLIAATDPVATLATYSSLGVEPLLNIIVFGESTVNDAVAIVVFDIMNSDTVFGDGSEMPASEHLAGTIFCGVVQKLVGSVLVGVVVAAVISFALRMVDLHHHSMLQILYIMVSCYFTFAVAESMHFSGIIANLFAGMMMSVYTKPHLSKDNLLLCNFFVKGMATLADTSIFLLVGVDILACTGASLHFSIYTMIFCIIARFVATAFWGIVVNLLKMWHGTQKDIPRDRWFLLSWKQLFMIWHAGLRGGIALMLALLMGDWVDKTDGPGTKQILVNTTLVVIVVFLLLFGGTTTMCLKALGIPMGQEYPDDYLLRDSAFDFTQSCWKALDERFLSPVLIGSSAEHGTTTSSDAPTVGEVLTTSDADHRHAVFHRSKSRAVTRGASQDSRSISLVDQSNYLQS